MGTPGDRDEATGLDGVGVAATQVATCQWRSQRTWRDYKCNLPVEALIVSVCSLHNPDPNKDLDKFNRTLWEKKEQEEADDSITEINLSGVLFPADAHFEDWVFQKAVTFAEAQFRGVANFRAAHFGGDASFNHAHFGGEAGFGGAQFGGEADFGNAHFGGEAYFPRVYFGDYTYFWGAHFGGAASFIHTGFPSQDGEAAVRFDDLAAESARNVRLEGVDLSRLSFLRADVSQIQFVGCTWAEKPAPLLWPLPIPRLRQRRIVIYDEVALDRPGEEYRAEQDRRLVALLYRQLRLNYEASRQEAEAGHFYVGQMEMRRQDRSSYSWLYRWLLAAYRVLAMYGESYLRPSFFYFLFGVLFALAYLMGGFQVGQAQVKYQWLDLDWGNTVPFLQHFVRAYVQALTAGGLLGTNLFGGQMGTSLETTSWWVPAVRYVNMLLDTFLVGFFVIALRRHFHR